ncbi:regulatory protein, luxR family [Actinacidiphila yanglinensis]|uniref:Regulatory protein, luxR family n=1 Tax=Actinacidiphila yanglinensis TaxID=310779 RepID=A0A1H6DT15_9ACTN|nr:helix-turn-helix transcriptional regulator [Actinacidiphila yanglinensis]SEG88389.1 regulatory protein, luxR family [Actinacidiphila yanglinensis]
MSDREDHALAVYQALRRLGGADQREVGGAAGLDQAQTEAALRRLTEIGLVQIGSGGQTEPVEPDTALVRTMDAYHGATKDQALRAEALHRNTQALLYVYRPAVGRVASKVQVEYVRGAASKRRTLAALNTTAQHSADSLHPGPMPAMEVLEGSLALDAQMVKRGVRVRAIYPESALQTTKYLRYLQELSDLGVRVRLIDHAPCDIVLQDEELACLPLDPVQPASKPMLLIRSIELVWTLSAIFDDYWLRATPLEDAVSSSDHEAELTPQERVIIRLMATGLSDDQIARKMGVHRRTVQRAIAKLMDRLHASSRFEAGLKLAQDRDLARVLPPSRNRPAVPAN